MLLCSVVLVIVEVGVSGRFFVRVRIATLPAVLLFRSFDLLSKRTDLVSLRFPLFLAFVLLYALADSLSALVHRFQLLGCGLQLLRERHLLDGRGFDRRSFQFCLQVGGDPIHFYLAEKHLFTAVLWVGLADQPKCVLLLLVESVQEV